MCVGFLHRGSLDGSATILRAYCVRFRYHQLGGPLVPRGRARSQYCTYLLAPFVFMAVPVYVATTIVVPNKYSDFMCTSNCPSFSSKCALISVHSPPGYSLFSL